MVLIGLFFIVERASFGSRLGVPNSPSYETTVGGQLGPINTMMAFLVPALIIVAVFGVLIAAGLVRVEVEKSEEK